MQAVTVEAMYRLTASQTVLSWQAPRSSHHPMSPCAGRHSGGRVLRV